MAIPTLAKIAAPQVGNVYLRKRLFKQLNQARKRPITWVSAPAGFGKTMLVASYLNETKLPYLWYQLDGGDGDIASFFYYMGLAGKKAAPRRRNPLPLLTPEYLAGLSTFTRNFFRDLFDRIKSPGMMVLDNYQDIPPDSSLHQVIADALLEVPEGINVVLISRSEPPAQFARLQASGVMSYIGWDDLRLTEEEALGIARHLSGRKKLRKESLHTINTQIQGWVAGLVLMLQSGKEAVLPNELSAQSNQEIIFAYFVSEVFQLADPELQRFLLKTALLPKFNVSVAKQLTSQNNAGQILSKLTREQFFTHRHTQPDTSYEYHPLFRNFLLAYAQQTFDEKEFNKLKRQAAQLLAETNQLDDAAALFGQTQDWQALTKLILQNAKTLLEQGRHITLEGWVRSLPEEQLQQQPWLLFWLASSRLPIDPLAARNYYEQAYQGFQQLDDATGLYLTWSSIVDTFMHHWDSFDALDQWIERLTELRTRFPNFPTAEIQIQVTAAVICALMFRQPQHPELRHWVEQGWQLLKRSSDLFLFSHLPFYLAHYFAWSGELSRYPLLIDFIDTQIQDRRITPLIKLGDYYIIGAWSWLTADWDSCDRAVTEGARIINETGIHIHQAELIAQAIYASLSQDDLSPAQAYLAQMKQHLPSEQRLANGHYHYLAGWYHFLQQDIERARGHAELALQSSIECGTPFPEALNRLGMAQIAFAQGQPEAAADHLAKALRTGDAMPSKLLQFHGHCVAAFFALENAEEEKCLRALNQALVVGRENAMVNYDWWCADLMSRLCAKALEEGIEVEYTQHLISKRHLIPEEEALYLDNWPWPVKVFTLGRFSLVVDDQPVQFKGKAQKRPLDLLKALIAFGGRDVSVEKLTDTLWPDNEGDAAYSAFSMNVQRLRKLLAHKDAIKLSEGQLSLDPRYCWVDAWVFERTVGKVITDPVKTQQALALYHGSFFNGEETATWALSMRTRLRRKFLSTISALGQYWEAQLQWQAAIDCYQHGLEVDDLAEALYQHLMECYGQLGQKGEALRTYQECLDNLNSRLGVTPSDKTEALHQRIQNH